jgi:hypothetical protein
LAELIGVLRFFERKNGETQLMNTSMTNSMIWRTTYAIGAYGIAFLFAYAGAHFAGESGDKYGLVMRVLAAGLLFLAAITCVILGRREMRDGRSTSSVSTRP